MNSFEVNTHNRTHWLPIDCAHENPSDLCCRFHDMHISLNSITIFMAIFNGLLCSVQRNLHVTTIFTILIKVHCIFSQSIFVYMSFLKIYLSLFLSLPSQIWMLEQDAKKLILDFFFTSIEVKKRIFSSI